MVTTICIAIGVAAWIMGTVATMAGYMRDGFESENGWLLFFAWPCFAVILLAGALLTYVEPIAKGGGKEIAWGTPQDFQGPPGGV
jgi:hypothetical protein